MKLELIDQKELDYPSASGIEYFDGQIYINGDDAGTIFVSNTRWKKVEKVSLFEAAEPRIPKEIKADLESSAMLQLEGSTYLLLLGSGSRETRNKGILYDVVEKTTRELDLSVFYNRLREQLPDLNIEGAAQVGKELVFANRGHKKNPANQFIITSDDFFRYQSTAPIDTLAVKRPPLKGTIGISGLSYSERHDLLLFTTSTENGNSEHNDETIGDSYLGVIENAHWKTGRRKMKVNELIELPQADKAFKGFKIESVCIQSTKKSSVKIQLVADNDDGKSHLFKAILKLK